MPSSPSEPKQTSGIGKAEEPLRRPSRPGEDVISPSPPTMANRPAVTHYHRRVRRVLLVTLALNLSIVLGKLILGWKANALSLLSDAGHSATDSINNIVGLLIIRLATAEADIGHPYGHRKIESLAAFSIGGILVLTCFEVAKSAISRLMHLSELVVHVSRLTVGGLGVAIAVNTFVYVYERRAGRALGSSYLLADALHTRSDILISSVLLVGLVGMKMGFPWLDPVLALIITGFIARAGWQIFQRTVPVLVDAASLEPARIRALVRRVPGVKEVYRIRSRSDGQHLFIEFNVSVTTRDVARAHRITEQIEEELAKEFGPCDVTIHVEPHEESGE